MHNTISSFVSSLISKHPYPYFNLNTITSAADILSVDSYMSIYAWSGSGRIRTYSAETLDLQSSPPLQLRRWPILIMSNNFVTLEGLEPSTPALRTCDRTQTCDPCWFISKPAHSINWTTQANAIFRDNRELKSAVLYLLSYKVNISAEGERLELSRRFSVDLPR